MNRYFNVSLAVVFAAGALSCSSSEGTGPLRTGDAIRVLFIGNSLTYTNDLPQIVESIGTAAGENIETVSVSYPNYALIDHWNDGLIQDEIRTGSFDYVVLQQGPSSLPVNRDSLRLVTALFDPVIRESGAMPALFAVWPDISRFDFFPDVAESYRLAAQDVVGVYLPVGNTWLAVWNQIPTAPLYGGDGYHPGLAGSYAAAVVMVSVLADRDPQSLPRNVPGISLDQALVNAIHQAAKTTISSSALLPR